MTETQHSDPILLVCNKHDDTMSYVDPVSLDVIETIPVGPNPHEIVITPDQRFAYLSNYAPPGDTISVIDLHARKHVKQISTGEYTRIHGAAICADGSRAYFSAGQTGYVVEVDTSTNEVTRAVPTHGEISHMVYVSPDDTRIYTANIETQNVSVIDRATGELVTQIPCGEDVEGMGFTPDGLELWAMNQGGGNIDVIEVATHQIVGHFDCPGMPVRVAFTADGRRAYVANWIPDGKLTVIDVPSQTEITRIPVGSQAIGVVLSADESRVFVGCEHTDGVHVIDTATLEVCGVVHTGDGSDAMAFWYPGT